MLLCLLNKRIVESCLLADGGMFMKSTPLERAILSAGSAKALSALMGVTPMAVSYWKARGLPARHAIRIEQVTGVPRQELRPDLYPPESLDEPNKSVA
jgi:DNA-binding transcriptional regulator YdaS (Cro superfamily)